GHDKYLHFVAFSPDGRRLASSSVDGTVKVWDADTGQEIRTLRGHKSWVGRAVFSPDGKLLASGTGTEFKLWDADTLEEVRTVETPAVWLAFTPDGRALLTTSTDDKQTGPHFIRWDVATGAKLREITAEGPPGLIYPLLSRDGKALFVCYHAPSV